MQICSCWLQQVRHAGEDLQTLLRAESGLPQGTLLKTACYAAEACLHCTFACHMASLHHRSSACELMLTECLYGG